MSTLDKTAKLQYPKVNSITLYQKFIFCPKNRFRRPIKGLEVIFSMRSSSEDIRDPEGHLRSVRPLMAVKLIFWTKKIRLTQSEYQSSPWTYRKGIPVNQNKKEY